MLAEVSTAFFVLTMLIFGVVGASTWSRLLSPDASRERTPTSGAARR